MSLKISLNANKVEGPYGGANLFVNGLEDYLQANGYKVYRRLVPDLDLILIVSAKYHFRTTAYDLDAIQDYIVSNPATTVIHRVNSCDEQRGLDLGIDRAMLEVNRLADYSIFISSFLRDLFINKGIDGGKPHAVVLNGADEQIFHPHGRADWIPGQKLRIVTHHWSSNYMKGFDIYERLDQLLAVEPFKNRFEFTYIGNIPLGVTFSNTRVIGPTSGRELADLLRQHHLYLTAARNEAAGMHHVEGMRCGLPPLFLNSGALPEYCAPYGVEFSLINFEQKLLEMPAKYAQLRETVLACPYSGSWMSRQYEKVFLEAVKKKRTHPQPEPDLKQKLTVNLFKRPYRKLKKLQRLGKKAVDYLYS